MAHSKQEGVTALEYALIAAAIAAVIVTIVRTTGQSVLGTFTTVNGGLTGGGN